MAWLSLTQKLARERWEVGGAEPKERESTKEMPWELLPRAPYRYKVGKFGRVTGAVRLDMGGGRKQVEQEGGGREANQGNDPHPAFILTQRGENRQRVRQHFRDLIQVSHLHGSQHDASLSPVNTTFEQIMFP